MASYKMILDAISQKYISIHIIDLVQDTYEAIKSQAKIDSLCKGTKEAQVALYNVFWNLTRGKSWKTVKKFINLSTLDKRLKEKNFVSCHFYSSANGWCEATFVPVMDGADKGISKVVFMVTDINEQVHRELAVVGQARRANVQIQRTAAQVSQDPLTGLLNLRGMENAINDFLKMCPAVNCVLMTLDVDDFKLINDVFGHSVGDMVLKKVADTLRKHCPKPCILARNGGDEFMIFLTNTSLDEIRPFLKSFVRQKVDFEHDGQMHHVSLSIGAAEYPTHTDDVQKLREYADAALYAVKMSDKNGYQFYYDGMEDRNRTQLGFKIGDIVTGLPGAIIVYKFNTNGKIVFANDDVLNLLGCDDMQDFMKFSHEKIYHIVHPDDRARVRRAVFQQYRKQLREKSLNDHMEGFVNCRLLSKQGKPIDVECTGRLVYNRFHGDIVYVFIQDTSTIKRYLRMSS